MHKEKSKRDSGKPALRVALVHDWLTNYGGAERVVEEFMKLFPEAPLFTTVYNRKNMESRFPPEKVHPSPLQRIPGSLKLYTKMLSLMPKAFESFDLSDYDVVLSSSSSCAKGVITNAETLHLSYIHTPMRYAWDLFHEYRRDSGWLTRHFMDKTMPGIRQWDQLNTMRIDHLMANSHTVARRIRKVYRRDSQVIFPPVDTHRLLPAENQAPRPGRDMGDYYFVLSRLIPYKRVDLAVEACRRLGRRLIVAGSGSEYKRLKKMAGPQTEFVGRVADEEAQDLYQGCRAFLFPGLEDFGITPVEAQACGRPVIAYGRGGALDTVAAEETGLFFGQGMNQKEGQTVEELMAAMEELEKRSWDPQRIRRHAEGFSAERFRREISQTVQQGWKDRQL